MRFVQPDWLAALVSVTILSCGCEQQARWYKGNLHTHSLWSDGDDFPEMIMSWYKQQGYHFVALSDHNTLAQGEKWVYIANPAQSEAYTKYISSFDSSWIETKFVRDSLFVRLKTLSEYRLSMEEPGRFLILQAQEITDGFEDKPVHVNATNLHEFIPPQGGASVREVLQNNVNAVLRQREQTGVAMFPHVNHPNYHWSVSVEDLLALKGENFFEVYNGHPFVNNSGDHQHFGTEKMWDILLANRLTRGRPVIYGLAVDDAHHYHEIGPRRVNPGRGWVVVRAPELSATAIVSAMEAGDFYASTGVEFEDIEFTGNRLLLQIKSEEGVSYRTQFIGTPQPLADVDAAVEDGSEPGAYDLEIGLVLKEVPGETPSYRFTGQELYVRAKVVSSKPKANTDKAGEFETAWTQPCVPPASN